MEQREKTDFCFQTWSESTPRQHFHTPEEKQKMFTRFFSLSFEQRLRTSNTAGFCGLWSDLQILVYVCECVWVYFSKKLTVHYQLLSLTVRPGVWVWALLLAPAAHLSSSITPKQRVQSNVGVLQPEAKHEQRRVFQSWLFLSFSARIRLSILWVIFPGVTKLSWNERLLWNQSLKL